MTDTCGEPRPIVVMKFGGTSVATKAGRDSIARRVSAAIELGKAPVLVVSAMGRSGDPYATDSLLALLGDAPTDSAERDLLMGTGELISSVVCAHELRAQGVEARAFTGPEAGIATDAVHGNASITEIHPGPLLKAITSGLVPVVAGFQGIAPDGRLATLGRGGSDTTACALGVALCAEAVEIYSDVDGVMTADPRTVEGTLVLETIRADELFQMARHGSRVVHTPAAELALASGLAVRVKNTYTEHPGTLVADISAYRPDKVATAVSHATGIARIRVTLPAPEGSDEHMHAQTKVYRAMADAGISLDMFTPVGDIMVFSIPESALVTAGSILDGLGLAYEVTDKLAKITLVGAGMHGVPGVMARMAECLDAAGVTVLQTADSHTTISVLVPADALQVAVTTLHSGFDLGE
ncbi:MAG: aspartate kinase [Coriobacteriia bacterium]